MWLWVRLTAGVALLGGVAFAAKEVNAWLTHDPHFQLACEAAPKDAVANCVSLEIRGAVYSSKTRLEAVFAQDFGTSVFHIPMAERRRHILAVDWVDTAAISRVWPNRIVVTVTERKPIAFAKLPIGDSARYRFALIDEAGVLLSLPPRVRFRLPVVSGLTEQQTEAERSRRLKAASHLLEDLGPLAANVSEVNAANTDDMRVVTEIGGHAVELWIGDQRYRSRYQHFVANYGEIQKHTTDSSVFDLRMDDRIAAR